MNRKYIGFVLIALVISTLFSTACKRYPDGPLLSIRSKKARVVNVWSAQLISINDRDLTKEYATYTIDFREDNSFLWESSLLSDTTEVTTMEGTWDFGGLKQELVLTMENTNGAFDTRLLYIELLRLKEKELWIRFLSREGDRTYLRLEPK